MPPKSLPSRFDAALAGMALCLAIGVGIGVTSGLSMPVATGGGATGAAVVALGVTVSEFM
ncbi:hypothetical protein E6P09_00335 [Haloferax mediterranei ATCC 33500]|uniref:Uncharacterized protein n=1 Tax=Haloferax mediterranei (strain ATCC 33500 / DSM 1411 / JCM 8866 / NBRC 14739 / NCIMB 2177 / R-4) TaxID=523841 RepID=A0A059TT08_HALMT|nr:hypothetical protein [Haloferax mediterranei]RLM48915.1 hypothetical protein DVK02_18485 [Halobellus sp. Atlit-31R]AHZ23336.1 hypothetical protein BM92_12110 [Haloferax mediterranei ATCC 33500]AIA57294.1 hypothetical protein HFX_2271A [Haloferax mediterranei ATCC 33500]MDX5987291.1 hypothetical protein [Haloferax mediterranei ATCC 33500]QCQ73811.1 hypothetical protein E6P09_00335 [Haloferax mediterranei ATCC 33500]